ncbi:MAG: T9SS type A sorting domain-containing protein [Saprospiraceae bacterium]
MPDPVINTIDQGTANPCLILPNEVCIEEGVYDFNLSDINIGAINLPLSNESYFLVYQRCCRNNIISNLINPSETGATYFIEITGEAQSVCNSTPTFDTPPTLSICVNEEFNFSQGTTDIDGDVLVYKLCSPLTGGGTSGWQTPGNPSDPNGTNPDPDTPPPYASVTFIPPTYSPLNPMGSDSGLSIDSATGDLTGLPNTIGRFEIGICVEEYRNGILLSETKREIQFNVTECNNLDIEASFSPMPDGNSYLFENTSIGAQSYSWDLGDGTTSNEINPVHVFTQQGSYDITLYAYNDFCILVDSTTQTIDVIVDHTDDISNKIFSVFPNPSNGDFYVHLENSSSSNYQIEVWNANGNLINHFPNEIFDQKQVEFKDLPKGIYFIKIMSGKYSEVKRIVVY